MKGNTRKSRRIGRLLFIIAVFTAAIIIGRIGTESPEVTQYDLFIDGLPQSFAGFKIVQVSDLHGADICSELIDAVKAEKPDIIALTGDLITTEADLPVAEKTVNALSEICDVYFVSGNHEYASGCIDAVCDIINNAGVRFLRNEFLALEREDGRLILAGVEDPNAYYDMTQPDELVYKLRDEYPTDPVVLLGHRNYWVTEYPELPVELILCGHEHGGVIRLPGIGGVLGHGRVLFPEYDAGAYYSGSYTMIVSRGLGNSLPVPRMFNPPEIVSITLR